MEKTMTSALPNGELRAADEAMFDRVWRRVMNQERSESPAPESDLEREERRAAMPVEPGDWRAARQMMQPAPTTSTDPADQQAARQSAAVAEGQAEWRLEEGQVPMPVGPGDWPGARQQASMAQTNHAMRQMMQPAPTTSTDPADQQAARQSAAVAEGQAEWRLEEGRAAMPMEPGQWSAARQQASMAQIDQGMAQPAPTTSTDLADQQAARQAAGVAEGQAQWRSEERLRSTATEQPQSMVPAVRERMGPDIGQEYQMPQLGPLSREYAPLLREMSEGEAAMRQDYQGLQRRNQGSMSRTLAALAADHQHCQRRLGAVYFLLTGDRCPINPARSNLPFRLEAALRALFMKEQRWMMAYRHGAKKTKDPCLAELFRELENQCGGRMDDIRRMLERI